MNDIEYVNQWLLNLSLSEYSQAFLDHHIEPWMLPKLADADLKDIGVISVGHRKRLLHSIAQSQTQSCAPSLLAPVVAAQALQFTAVPAVQETASEILTEPKAPEKVRSLKLFLSYGRDNYVDEVRALKNALEARGHQVWFDQEQLGVGLDWERRIEEGLAWCDRVVLTMTPHSVRRPDGYCLNELAKAMERQKVIIPVLLIDVPNGAPTSICRIQYLDWRDAVPAAQKQDRFTVRMARLCEAIEQDKLDFEGGQQRLLRILQPINYAGDIDRHVARFSGRKVLFERLRYWLNDPLGEQVVWLCGSSGMGKSAVVAMLAHNWAETGAVHFCVAGHVDKADPRRAILSIAFQLSTHIDLYRSRLMSIDLEQEAEKDAQSLFDALLVGPLSGDFPLPSHPWLVVIDALDEATQVDGQNSLAELIGQEWPKLPSWLRLAVSSQPEGEVQTWLSDVTQVHLKADDEEQLSDLRDYVKKGLQSQGRDPSDTVLDQIVERSEGAFQYVALLLEEIRQGRCNPEDAVELPRGMLAAYLQSFKRRFPDFNIYVQQGRPLLDIILASTDPVPISIVAGILKVTPSEIRRRVSLFGSMIALHPSDDNRDPAWDTLRLSQASLRKWLTSIDDRTRQSVAGVFAAEPELGLNLLSQEVLSRWDACAGKSNTEVPGFVSRQLFELLHRAGHLSELDRISLALSKHWEKISLSRALPPAKHAVESTKNVINQADAPTNLLMESADALHHLGKLLYGMGQSSDAMANFRSALQIRERVKLKTPESLEVLQALAESRSQISKLIRSQGDLKAALTEQTKSLSIFQELVVRDPQNMTFKKLLADSLNLSGNLLRVSGDVDAALEDYRNSLALREELVQLFPGNLTYQRDVGGSHNNIGIVLRSKGDLEGALTEHRKFQSSIQKIQKLEPHVASWKLALTTSHHNLSLLFQDMGRNEDAKNEAQASVLIREKLAQEDPDNSEYQRIWGDACVRIGNILKASGDLDGALLNFQKNHGISQNLKQKDPFNATWLEDLASSHSSLGGALEDLGKFSESLSEFRKSLEIRNSLVAKDSGNPNLQGYLANTEARISGVLKELGDLPQALIHAKLAISLRERLVTQFPKNTIWLQQLTSAYSATAGILQSQELLDDALELAHKALTIRGQLVQRDQVNAAWQEALARGYERVASIYLLQNSLEEAYLNFERASTILNHLLKIDPNNATWLDKISDIYAQLGWVLERQGKLYDALNRYQEDLRISDELVSTGTKKTGWNRDLALAHLNCGRVLHKQQEFQLSEIHLCTSAKSLSKLADPLRPGSIIDFLGAQAMLADTYEAQGETVKAQEIDLVLADTKWSESAADSLLRRQLVSVISNRLQSSIDKRFTRFPR